MWARFFSSVQSTGSRVKALWLRAHAVRTVTWLHAGAAREDVARSEHSNQGVVLWNEAKHAAGGRKGNVAVKRHLAAAARAKDAGGCQRL
jgi:hypothetical protein